MDKFLCRLAIYKSWTCCKISLLFLWFFESTSNSQLLCLVGIVRDNSGLIPMSHFALDILWDETATCLRSPLLLLKNVKSWRLQELTFRNVDTFSTICTHHNIPYHQLNVLMKQKSEKQSTERGRSIELGDGEQFSNSHISN